MSLQNAMDGLDEDIFTLTYLPDFPGRCMLYCQLFFDPQKRSPLFLVG